MLFKETSHTAYNKFYIDIGIYFNLKLSTKCFQEFWNWACDSVSTVTAIKQFYVESYFHLQKSVILQEMELLLVLERKWAAVMLETTVNARY
jgi:hypothetical protein